MKRFNVAGIKELKYGIQCDGMTLIFKIQQEQIKDKEELILKITLHDTDEMEKTVLS